MTDPETRHTETMDEEAEATARSWSHETPVGDANRVAEERVGNLARAYLALLSEVATLRADIAQRRNGHDDLSEANWDMRKRLAMAEAEIARLRPYEAKYKATTFGGDTTIVVMPRPTPPTETRDD